MQASKFGEPLCQAFQLELFRSGADEWRKRMHSSVKIKAQYERLFADSIAKEAKAKRKSKKRKGKDGPDDLIPAQEATGAQAAYTPAKSRRIAEGNDDPHAETDEKEPQNGRKKKDRRVHAGSAGHIHVAERVGDDVTLQAQYADSVAGERHKKQKSGRVDIGSRQPGNKNKSAAGEGRAGTGAPLKPSTDAKSVVDEVMAELAIGSGTYGSGGRKNCRKRRVLKLVPSS